MLKRLFYVIAGILAFIFVPYYTGILIINLTGWDHEVVWLIGASFDMGAFVFIGIISILVMYIKKG